jgi:hypothetical protein
MRRASLILAAILIVAFSVNARGQGSGLPARGTKVSGEANKGSAGPPAAQRGARSANKPTGGRISPAQQQNIDKLVADLNLIKQGSQVTQTQKDALKADLMAMADGATRPDQALVQQLANDLAEAMSDGNLSQREKSKLASDLKQVMNSANIPASEVNQAISDAQAIVAASGVSKADAQTIANDLKAIASEAQKRIQNSGKGSQNASPYRARPRRP